MPKDLDIRGAVDSRGVLEAAVHPGDAGPRGPNEEWGRHERLRQDHGESGKRDFNPDGVERPAEEAAPAEGKQQREARDGRRQHKRQIDDRLDQPGAPKPPPGQDVGQRKTQGNCQREADGRRRKAQGQGREDDLGGQRAYEQPIEDRACHQDCDR